MNICRPTADLVNVSDPGADLIAKQECSLPDVASDFLEVMADFVC